MGKNSFPGKCNPKLTDEQKEIAELKKKLRDTEIERDIPKKAIAIPARRQAGSPRARGKIEVHKTP
jgi:transposase-like protein